jgi:hypothetical protein
VGGQRDENGDASNWQVFQSAFQRLRRNFRDLQWIPKRAADLDGPIGDLQSRNRRLNFISPPNKFRNVDGEYRAALIAQNHLAQMTADAFVAAKCVNVFRRTRVKSAHLGVQIYFYKFTFTRTGVFMKQ